MTQLQSFLPLAVALLGLVTAWIGYRAASRRAIQNNLKVLNIAKLDDPSIPTKRWNVRRLRLAMIGLSSLYVLAIVALFWEPVVIVSAAIGTGLSIGLMFLVRTEPPSLVRKTVVLELHVSSAEALQRCVQVLEQIGASVAKIETEEEPQIAIARTPASWRSWGDIVSVTVSSVSSDLTRIRLESDSISPAMIFDFGSNARNIRRFKSALLGAS
jgi:hypothetical protein